MKMKALNAFKYGKESKVTWVAVVRGAGLGDFLKIPANPPLFSCNKLNNYTALVNNQWLNKQMRKQG